MNAPKTAIVLLAMFASLGQVSMAQEEVEQFKLTFRTFPEAGPGEYSPVEGTVGAVAHEFYMDGLDVLQPIAVVLQARDSSANLRLQLRSYAWTDPLREKATDNEGRAMFRVRSTGDLYARVVSSEGTEETYQLVIWKGEPVTVEQVAEEFRPAVVPASEYEEGGSGSSILTSPWSWIALLAICGLIITFVVRRRGQEMKNMVVWAVLLGLSSCLSADLAQAQVRTPGQIPFHELWPITQDVLETTAKAGKTAQSSEEYLREYENLSETDCFDLDMDGMPQVPSTCAESAGCGACYTDALRRLTFVRGQFEWLRCKYQTTRSFALSAIAFGDNVSGVHAVSGLAWQTQRRQIMESLRRFGETYDEQYEAGTEALQEALRKLGRCEAEYSGEEDWYNRFGFVYYTFMKDRYKRSVVE